MRWIENRISFLKERFETDPLLLVVILGIILFINISVIILVDTKLNSVQMFSIVALAMIFQSLLITLAWEKVENTLKTRRKR